MQCLNILFYINNERVTYSLKGLKEIWKNTKWGNEELNHAEWSQILHTGLSAFEMKIRNVFEINSRFSSRNFY
jgi:hypothetical protein